MNENVHAFDRGQRLGGDTGRKSVRDAEDAVEVGFDELTDLLSLQEVVLKGATNLDSSKGVQRT